MRTYIRMTDQYKSGQMHVQYKHTELWYIVQRKDHNTYLHEVMYYHDICLQYLEMI